MAIKLTTDDLDTLSGVLEDIQDIENLRGYHLTGTLTTESGLVFRLEHEGGKYVVIPEKTEKAGK